MPCSRSSLFYSCFRNRRFREEWHIPGKHGYSLGEEGVRALGKHPITVFLHALNPVTYSGAFEVWNYPFPFHSTHPLGTTKIAAAYCIMIAWAMLICWALRTEIQ